MAIYAVQGLYAIRCLYGIYGLFESGLSLSFSPKPVSGEAKEFIDTQAKEMKIGKEIVVIEGRCRCYDSYGNTWLPGKAVIQVPEYGDKKMPGSFRSRRKLRILNSMIISPFLWLS